MKTFINNQNQGNWLIYLELEEYIQCIPAHTFILTEISPPFEAMFSGNWTEAANGEVSKK
jgi:hypothetical protein